MKDFQVIVLGGGAAGLTAAIAAARAGASVQVLEARSRIGSSILATGNGRSNLSHTPIFSQDYNNPAFVETILARFTPERIHAFFEDMGLVIYTDEAGRVYPLSNAASSVLDVLRLECDRLGVEVACDFKAVGLTQLSDASGFNVASPTGACETATSVVVTTGGGSSVLAKLGHTMVNCTPVLAPLSTQTEPIKGLSGVRVRCSASLLDDASHVVATERGELLFRDYGVSGIMVFDLSRYLENARTLSIDFLPDISREALIKQLEKRREIFATQTAETYLTGMFHSRLARALLNAARIGAQTPVPEISCKALADAIKHFNLALHGVGDAKQAQVMRGGLAVDEFDANTLASKRIPGLFAAGEVLDIDGRCGGYNLHWAWSSGLVAGEQAAKFATRQRA